MRVYQKEVTKLLLRKDNLRHQIAVVSPQKGPDFRTVQEYLEGELTTVGRELTRLEYLGAMMPSLKS